MPQWSWSSLLGFSRLLALSCLSLCVLLPLQGILGVINLAFEVGDASLCECKGFDGFDRGKFIKAHAHIYAKAFSIPRPALLSAHGT